MEDYLLRNVFIGSFVKQFNQKYCWKVIKYSMIIGIQQILSHDIKNYKQLKYHAYSLLKDHSDEQMHQQKQKQQYQLNDYQSNNTNYTNQNVEQSHSSLILKQEIQMIKEQLAQLNRESQRKDSLSKSNRRRNLTIGDLQQYESRERLREKKNINQNVNQQLIMNNSLNHQNNQMGNSSLNRSVMNQSLFEQNSKYKRYKQDILQNVDSFLNSKLLQSIKNNFRVER